MCGIIGYCGGQEAAPILVEGLRRLEYRGYDSAGVATIFENRLHQKKGAGHLDQVEENQHLSILPGKIGIGHVRWATHGQVNQINAHPLIDNRNEIAVVHNGIIENASELKVRLGSRHKFLSETDTEVLPHMISDYMRSGVSLVGAVHMINKEITGLNAFLAISSTEPDTIVGTSNDVPLLIGIGADGTYVASDVTTLFPVCSQVVYLENGETVAIRPEGMAFLDNSGNSIEKKAVDISRREYNVSTSREGYHMLDEIIEQPHSIQRTLVQDREFINNMALEILKARQVVITACGSSRYAALLGRFLFSRIGKKFSDVIIGSEFRYYYDSMDQSTLILAVSQSGETADVLEGVKVSKAAGARIFSIVNNVQSRLGRMSDAIFPMNCGHEIAVAATKTFTAEVVLFYLLSFAMCNRLDEISRKIKDACEVIEAHMETNIRQAREMARKLALARTCYFIARGSNLHIATEAALKLKEIAYVSAEGMPAGELKHGTLALIEKNTPVFVICPRDSTYSDTVANAAEAKARGAYIIGVSDANSDVFDEWVKIPQVDEILYPLVSIMPLQLFAYYSALERGYNPDRPRNLAKSVTVK